MSRLSLKFLFFLVRLVLKFSKDPILQRTRELIEELEQIRIGGKPIRGERKRSNVLNRLISEFPEARTKDLAILIEHVLQARS